MRSIWEKLAREIGSQSAGRGRSRRTAPVDAEGGWRDGRWWANRSYRLLCFGIGLVFLEVYLLNLDHNVARVAFPFAVLNMAAALHSVAFPSFGRISFHFILTYGNLLLFGPGIAALSAGLGIFGHYLFIRRQPLSVSMFHMGSTIVAVTGAGWTFSMLGGRWGWPNLGWTMVISSAAAYLIIEFALEVIPSLWSPSISIEHLSRSMMHRALLWVVFVPASVSMFYIYFPYGADGVLLFLVPLAAFGLALELYTRSTNISRKLSVVQEISRKVSTILDPDRLAGEALESIAEIVSYQWGAVWLRDTRTGNLKAPYCISAAGVDKPIPPSPPRAALRAAQEGRPMDFTRWSGATSDFSDDLPWQHMLALPIASRGEVYGVLGLSSPSVKGFSSQDHRLLETLADNVAIAVQNAMLYQQREREAIRDGLTRLFNHRFLQEKLVLEVERFKRYGRPFSLIMIDIDHFKRFNDAFGHPEGDSLLVILAGILKESVRQVDFVARYGGEEFAMVLPECDKEEAQTVAERVRSRVEAFQNPHGDRYNLTISAGVSTFPTDGDSKEQLLDQADQALYRAKAEGRNRVCV